MKTIEEIRAANPKWGMSRKHKAPPLLEQQRILREQGNKCYHCGIVLTAVEWDHLIPYRVSRTSELGSHVASCKPCNRRKGGRLLRPPRPAAGRATAPPPGAPTAERSEALNLPSGLEP